MTQPNDPVDDRQRDSGTWRLAVAIAASTLAIHLVLAAVVPLFPDETYYWVWSRHLAPGYFDHPFGIAFLIRIGTLLLGDNALGVRLGAVLAGFATVLLVLAMTRRLAGDAGALLASLTMACLPLAAGGLLLATPDAPLLLADAMALYALLRAVSHPPRGAGSLRWWLLAGGALGLCLDSKYTAVLLPLGILAGLLALPTLRSRFAEWGPYLGVLVALLLFAPVILWNAHHDWISFRFQLTHGLGAPHGSALRRELELVGAQAGLASPILFALMIASCVGALRREGDHRRALVSVVALTPFVFFLISALRRPVEANWPAPAILAAVVVLGATGGGEWWRRWRTAGLMLGGALVVVTYIHAVVPILPIAASADPVARSFGFDTLAMRTDDARRAVVAAAPQGGRTWIAANRYQDASELAFHLPDQPEVFSLNLSGRANQYDLWPTFFDRAGAGDQLVLVADDGPDIPRPVEMLTPHFESVHAGALVVLRRGQGEVERRRIWVLRGWRCQWPTLVDSFLRTVRRCQAGRPPR
ncbi:MAG: glycosyltransferase family 39 protein [Gemmatimonadota bacterium]|nr:glycosyltransferase family 39 protein [Gemmatimonadota bacterium]